MPVNRQEMYVEPLKRLFAQTSDMPSRDLKACRATLRAILDMDDVHEIHMLCRKFLGEIK